MADLRSNEYKDLKSSYDKIVTVGADGGLEDGKGGAIAVKPKFGALVMYDLGDIAADSYKSIELPIGSSYNDIFTLEIHTIEFNDIPAMAKILIRSGNNIEHEILYQSNVDRFETATGNPDGQTGTSGKITVFVGNRIIHIENRLTAAREFSISLTGKGIT